MSRISRRPGSFLKSLNPFSRPVDRALEWKRSRRLRVEALEDRRVLAVDVFIDSVTGFVTVMDESAPFEEGAVIENNNVTFSFGNFNVGGVAGVQDGLLITDPGGADARSVGVVQISPTEVFVPANFDFGGVIPDVRPVLTATVVVDLQGGDDTLTLNEDLDDVPTVTDYDLRAGDNGSGSDSLIILSTVGVDESIQISPRLVPHEQLITGFAGVSLSVSGMERVLFLGDGIAEVDNLTVELGLAGTEAYVRGAGDSDVVITDILPLIEFSGFDTFTLSADDGISNTGRFQLGVLSGASNYAMISGSSDTLILEGGNSNSDSFIISDADGAGGNVLTASNNSQVLTVLGSIGREVRVLGLGGNDSLTVDLTGSELIPVPIFFDGGAGFDTLTVSGTPVAAIGQVVYTPGLQVDEGKLSYQAGDLTMQIEFDNLEPVVDLAPAAALVVNGTNAANHITYTVGSADDRGLVAIDGFETIEFQNKTALTINGLSGDDTIVVNNPNLPTGLTTLTVNGDAGHDEIRLEALPDAAATTYGTTVVSGGVGNDIIDGSTIVAGTPLVIDGNSGNDTITGGAGTDTIQGGIGDDIIFDTPGNDNISGGAGEDQYFIRGNSLNNTILVTQNAPSAVAADFYSLTVVNLGLNSTKSIGKTAALAPSNPGNRPDIERIVIEGLGGSDQISITQADEYSDLDPNNGQVLHTIPFTVDGGISGTDRLLVNDAGLGDLVIQRVSADSRDGSFQVGGMAPIEYTGIEFPLVAPLNAITGGTGTDGLGRLVVFKYDPFEINDTLPTATFLGSGPTVNVDPTIDPSGFEGFPGDSDFYQFVAQETGTLDLQLYFEPIGVLANGRPGLYNDGELVVTAFDSDGLPIAIGTASDLLDPAGNKIGERITLPVVRNNTYYLRVQGEVLDGVSAINVYNFTGITVAAPIPELVDLQAASDSGRHNGDNITKITTPTFDIILDDDRIDEFMNIDLIPDTVNDDAQTLNNAGGMRIDYGVEVFNNGVSIGFAFYTGVGNTWQFTATAGDLNEGDFNHISAAVWIRDRADPAVIGRHLLSDSLQVTLDTMTPPGSFGLPDAQSTTDGLVHSTDSGVITTPALYADRVTSDTTPTFWGIAEADTIVRVFLDINNNGIIDLGTDILLGQDVATPEDGNVAYPDGFWEITSVLDLNQVAALPKDGVRRLLMTAEDVAGNPMPMNGQIIDGIDELFIFLDTQGPQVFDPPGPIQPIFIPGFEEFDLFDPKPSINGYTPLVNQLTINVRDLPFRSDVDPNFLYVALQEDVAEALGNYVLVGDHVGTIGITAVDVVNIAPVDGEQATATITLTFAAPLPDDRYTLTIKDALVDPAGNALDGESNANGPLEDPTFPSGDGVPGGNFVARFTVDSRPEIGTYIPTTISIDINGNFVWDPANSQIGNDFTNVDLTFNMQLEDDVTGNPISGGYGVHDLVFAGKFVTDQLLVGDDVVFVIDISGSTFDAFGGDPVGDLNGDGVANTILDAEIAGFIALNQQLVDRGLGNTAKVAIVAFDSSSSVLDMNPILAGLQASTTPLADANGNGIRDVDEVLRALSVAGGTDFEAALQGAISAIAMAGIAPGNGNVIFLSDGFGSGGFLDEVNTIRNTQNMNLRAFGVGPGASLMQLQQIDPAAIAVSNTNELLAALGGGGAGGGAASGRAFDQLAVFGALNQTTYRWLIDTNSDGVVNTGDGDIFTLQPRFVNGFDTAGAIPIAGNFDNNANNGDEIGLYNAGRWALDTNHNFVIDPGDTFITSNLFGNPIVGDFNGDGFDDLAVHNSVSHLFQFDLDRNGTIDDTINWGFPGVLELPVAADMNQDGIDDIGLWVPRNSTQVPRAEAEWFFLISDNTAPIGFNVNNLDHAFKIVPFGTDITAHFGDELARPIVGNFDPPVTNKTSAQPGLQFVYDLPGDFNMDGKVDNADQALWKSQFGRTGNDLAADGNHDGKVDMRDFTIWRNNVGSTVQAVAAAISTPGDYDGNGVVELADREVWLSQYGQTGTGLSADGNGDGKVDSRDFVIWRNNLESAAPTGSAAGLAAADTGESSSLVSAATSPGDGGATRSIGNGSTGNQATPGFRPSLRSSLSDASTRPTLWAETVDAAFADDADDLLLLVDGAYVAEDDKVDWDALFDLSNDEAEEEAELPLTL